MKITGSERRSLKKQHEFLIDEDDRALDFLCDLLIRSKRLVMEQKIDGYEYFEKNIQILSRYGIRGEKLSVFYNHMCDQNFLKYDYSMYMLELNYYTYDEVYSNFESKFPVPLIYDDFIGKTEDELFKYFDLQRKKYVERKENVSPRLRLVIR